MAASYPDFVSELKRLCTCFEQGSKGFLAPTYSEARLRADFLDPFFRALGWDMENRAGLIQTKREVEIESRTDMAGRRKLADYLFRTDGMDRFICEAKKPAEELRRHAFQTKRYAWNKGVWMGILSDFEDLHIFIVGHKPHPDEPEVGLWRKWHFSQYIEAARDLWDLLSREAIAEGSIDKLVDSLPRKKPTGKVKARQQWLIKPDRSRALDAEFLNLLDRARQGLGTDLLHQNNRDDLLIDNRLNEAVQRILDRLLFLRICEDRDIDTGRPLARILRNWREHTANPPPTRARELGLRAFDDAGGFLATSPRPAHQPLWREIVDHFKALDRRPPSHIPFFNGNLFKEHFSETLHVGDEWLAGFLDEISDEETPYLFNVIPVEMLGTIYERFLGKVVRPQGRGTTVEEKPEVRKAGGVYYTPRYIVDYIVEQTVGKLLDGRTPEKSLDLKILDPACGSGSFLIRVFERLCEHWQQDFKNHPSKRNRQLCWVNEPTGDVHLTTELKRRILTANIYGVDLDPGAVEVTQLSLYLKMLEGETRHTLAAERELFGNDTALLPPLQDNVKCGNSLIASDFSLDPDELVRVRAFDWDVQFRNIMKKGGFDAVVGNPPYVRQESLKDSKAYFKRHYKSFSGTGDLYTYFMERGVNLLKPDGRYSIIVSSSFLRATYAEPLRETLGKCAAVHRIVDFGGLAVFADAKDTYVCIPVLTRGEQPQKFEVSKVRTLNKKNVAAEMTKTDLLVSSDQLRREGWVLRSENETNLLHKIIENTIPLGQYIDNKMFYGIKTGFNAAFVITTDQAKQICERLPACEPLIHPVRGGEDIREYFIKSSDCWLIVLPSGWTRTTMGTPASESKAWAWLQEHYAPLADHVLPFKKQLQSRQDQGEFWWELRPCDYYDVFAKPKIIFPDICKFPRFCYDDTGIYLTNTAYALGTGDKYLLGLLGSKVFWFAISNISIPFGVRAGEFRYRLIYQYMENVPIRVIDQKDPSDRARHDQLVGLVNKMLVLMSSVRAETNEAKKRTLQNAVAATDRQIDRLVYELYDLTEEEIALVEGE